MSPILDLQRRLVQVGRIRMGASEPTSSGHKRPKRLGTWRLTSRDQVRLEQAAEHYGGTVQAWEGHAGEYVLDTDVDALPIAVLPGQNLSVWYELWGQRSKAKAAPIECLRRCDGQTETLSDKPCQCDPEARECKPRTRLSVLLTEVPGIGCWRFDSSGWYAAVELSGTAELLEQCTASGRPYPARLRIDQRRGVKDGQAVAYPVPVLDIATTLGEALATLGGSAVLPQLPAAANTSHTPLPPSTGVGLAEGLAGAAAQAAPRATSARSAQPIGPAAVELVAAPLPVDDGGPGGVVPLPTAAAAPPTSGNAPEVPYAAVATSEVEREPEVLPMPGEVPLPLDEPPEPAPKAEPPPKPKAGLANQAQKKKLDVLVGKLREAGKITTAHLWAAVGQARNLDVEVMAELLEGRDPEGVLHWAPLRESLGKDEASNLIDRLEKFGG